MPITVNDPIRTVGLSSVIASSAQPEFIEFSKDRTKRFLSWLNRPLAQARFRKAVSGAKGLRIQVGAGPARLPGWINTDVYWRASWYLDVTKPWGVAPGSVSHVYGDNMIEHLTLDDGRRMLRYAFGALAAGGRIRLATPDVERIARIYLDDPDTTADLVAWHRTSGRNAVHAVDLLRIYFTHWGHQLGYLYDFASLSAELRQSGFTNITRCGTGESTDPVFCNLETRTDAEASIQLIVEAERGVRSEEPLDGTRTR